MPETNEAIFPLKVRADRSTIELLKATAEGDALEILGRFTSQVKLLDQNELQVVISHIREQHGLGSPNGVPHKSRSAVGSLFHKLYNANPIEEEDMSQDNTVEITSENEIIAERTLETPDPFSGMSEAEIIQKMQDDIEVEILIEREQNGETDGFPEDDTDILLQGLGVEDSGAELPEENPESRAAAKVEAADSLLKWTVDRKVGKGELSEDQAKDILSGKRDLDEVVAENKKSGVQLKATTNPARASETKPKRSKGKAKKDQEDKPKKAPKPRAPWSIIVMDEAGEKPEETVVDNAQPSEYGGCVKMGEFAQSIANERGRLVLHVNNSNGKSWKKKPQA